MMNQNYVDGFPAPKYHHYKGVQRECFHFKGNVEENTGGSDYHVLQQIAEKQNGARLSETPRPIETAFIQQTTDAADLIRMKDARIATNKLYRQKLENQADKRIGKLMDTEEPEAWDDLMRQKRIEGRNLRRKLHQRAIEQRFAGATARNAAEHKLCSLPHEVLDQVCNFLFGSRRLGRDVHVLSGVGVGSRKLHEALFESNEFYWTDVAVNMGLVAPVYDGENRKRRHDGMTRTGFVGHLKRATGNDRCLVNVLPSSLSRVVHGIQRVNTVHLSDHHNKSNNFSQLPSTLVHLAVPRGCYIGMPRVFFDSLPSSLVSLDLAAADEGKSPTEDDLSRIEWSKPQLLLIYFPSKGSWKKQQEKKNK